MKIFRTNRPFVKLYDSPNATVPTKSTGAGTARFVGDGTQQNGKLKVTWEGEAEPIWWVSSGDLDDVSGVAASLVLPPVDDLELHEDCVLAARMMSGFLNAGAMNAEYLLLLAWAVSGWTNTDTEGRDGSDANLDGPIGPFRFEEKVWASLLDDKDYSEPLRDFHRLDRIKPQAQSFFAAAYANRLQRALKKTLGIDPPARLLRVGHTIGEVAVVRFAQLADTDPVSTKVGGVGAVSAATANANPKLFPQKSATIKSEVLTAVKAEFESAKRSVVKRLGELVQESAIDGMLDGSAAGMRQGALGLLDFVGQAEAGGNYNAVVDRPKNENNPRLTAMTIGQVLDYQKSLGVRNACGKYQVVRSTLNGNYGPAGLSIGDTYDTEGQDKIAYHLLMTVRKGEAFLNSGRTQADFEKFALAVAQEWAAMPVLKAMTGHNGVALVRGDSYYKGTAGNQAIVSAAQFEAAIKKHMV